MQQTQKKVSYLENFLAYVWYNATDNYNKRLNKLNQRNFYKPHGTPQYSASMVWCALHLRYTSLQARRLLFEKFPRLSLPLLNKIPQSGVDALKALKTAHNKSSFPCDCILIIDEIYLRKSAQYQSGEYVGVDEEGNLYKGFETLSDSMDNLIESGLCVRGIVTDNNSGNVNAFSALIKKFFNAWW